MALSREDRARIQASVARAETQTTARFATLIVPASDRYALYPLAWGAMFALMIGAGAALILPAFSLRLGVMLEAGAFLLAALLLEWLPLRLLLVPGKVKSGHARDFAHRAFAAQILSPEDGRDGILFFVSLAEHYVEVIATRHVHEKVGETEWNAIVSGFLASARNGRIADGAIAAIEACAKHLATHLPATGPGDPR